MRKLEGGGKGGGSSRRLALSSTITQMARIEGAELSGRHGCDTKKVHR